VRFFQLLSIIFKRSTFNKLSRLHHQSKNEFRKIANIEKKSNNLSTIDLRLFIQLVFIERVESRRIFN